MTGGVECREENRALFLSLSMKNLRNLGLEVSEETDRGSSYQSFLPSLVSIPLRYLIILVELLGSKNLVRPITNPHTRVWINRGAADLG